MKFNNIDVKSLNKFMIKEGYQKDAISEIISFIKNNGERVFELNVGELYKTRNGAKVFIHYENSDNQFCYRGCIEGYSLIFGWQKDGVSCSPNKEFDITEYWIEESL